MTLAVHPPGGRESIGVLSKKILIYTASLMLSGALTGFLYSILFFLIGTLLPEPVKIMILSSLAFLYILHEGGIFRLKVPQHHWQIPSTWVNRGDGRDLMVWGTVLGAGIFTYIPHVSFYILYLFTGFFMNPLIGIPMGALYGFSRMLPTWGLALASRMSGRQRALDLTRAKGVKILNRGLNGIVLMMTLIYLVLQA
ncbi:hypothetical protein GCM10007416_07170 [Kroppenstedtia guangzhouensis]|uniref:Urease accessory protein UreH-like transmembrane domain-containing protein n=1 Tax=Kroppenstedtia guangzhouensis TaxID=1274356 RepID=A0ABQ1G4W3_9BACL|nr:hypothetical protein [Kroppenstedtia guangzhouensis]GGA36793.1 hypothetical protein GCM10007416_07170 [Kroppenstedtia guangzhouensis]